MRILFLLRSLEAGGAERQAIVLAKGLVQRGHQVRMLTFYNGGGLAAELKGSGVEAIALGKRGRWDIVPFMARLTATIRDFRPDVLCPYLSVPNLLAVALKPFTGFRPVVWGVRDSDVPLSEYDWMARATARMEAFLARSADRIIVNSHAGYAHAQARGFPPPRMVVVPNGIDTHRFRPKPELRGPLRAEFGFAEDDVVVGVVARLDVMKGHEYFLRAAKILRARHPHMRFLCVGRGDRQYAMHLRTIADQLGCSDVVTWLPARNNIADFYCVLDVLCSSSSCGEGFSNVIGEAMSCGIPCAVTAVGDSPRIVGDCGAVARPSDPDSLADAIEQAWDNRERAAAGRRRVEDNFSIDALVKKTESILMEAL